VFRSDEFPEITPKSAEKKRFRLKFSRFYLFLIFLYFRTTNKSFKLDKILFCLKSKIFKKLKHGKSDEFRLILSIFRLKSGEFFTRLPKIRTFHPLKIKNNSQYHVNPQPNHPNLLLDFWGTG
jgi:hypothetical protein